MEIQLARTYEQIQGQIAKLQSDAEKLRKREAADVIARIKEAIGVYGLTTADLFGGRAFTTKQAAKPATESAAHKSKSKISTAPKFADGSGNEWVGRGPRPQWLRDALDAGKSLSDYAVGAGSSKRQAKAIAGKGKTAKAPSKSIKSKTVKSKSVAIKYRDGAGNTWTGRGSQPRWLKAAIGAGQSVEQFLI
jgi:DNA-binding protein H-NS